MHICFLCAEYPPHSAGLGNFTQTLAHALVRRGHRVTVVGLYPPERAGVEDDAGVRVVRLAHSRVPRTGLFVNGARVRAALRTIHAETPIDVIEGPEWSLTMLPARTPARKVIRMHGGHHFFATTLGRRPRRWDGWWERRSFRRADHLCAVSRFVAETTRQLLGLGGAEIDVIPNPVDVSRFAPSSRPEEEETIVFVGTVCEKKGVRQLVEAMPLGLERRPAARLRIVGPDWIDPASGASYIEGLRRAIPATAAPHIELAGGVPNAELPRILGAAAVAVYPSHMEALPVAWLEAMAMGKAVVASRTGPGPEVIEDGVSGLLCDPHDPRSIADAIVRLLDDPGLRRRLGAAARARAERHFSTDVAVERNERFYRRCIGEGAHA